ncbi:MAG: hypothetical protein AAF125_18220, partial [Chloroflexota bacterium]
MNLGIKRRKIEDRIVDHFTAVDFKATDGKWVDSKTFEDFVFSFFELRRYYETSDDVALGLDTIRIYTAAARMLQAAAADRALSIAR